MRKLLTASAACALILYSGAALAKKPHDMEVRKNAEFGSYLVTGDGLALYMFSRDVRGKADRDAVSNCRETCRQIWRPFLAGGGMPVGGKRVNRDMIGTVDLGKRDVTTYNGWPLYRYISDNVAGETDGASMESFNGRWSLISPTGKAVSVE